MPVVAKARGAGISYFDKVDTYASWDANSCGIKDVITENLSIFAMLHQDLINEKVLAKQ